MRHSSTHTFTYELKTVHPISFIYNVVLLLVVLQSTKCCSLTSVGDNQRQDDDLQLMFYSTLCNCCDDDEMIIGLMGIKNKLEQFIYMYGRRNPYEAVL